MDICSKGDSICPKEKASTKSIKSHIETALFSSAIIWNTIFVDVISETKFIQKCEQIIKNQSKDPISFIKLPPRRKTIQRNIKILSSSGEELVHVPSNILNENLILLCEEYLKKSIKEMTTFELHEKKQIPRLLELKERAKSFDFFKVFSYEKNYHKEIGSFLDLLEEIDSFLFDEKKSIPYLKRLGHLLSIYGEFYIPIIKLNKELESNFCVLILYSIEKVTRKEENVTFFHYLKFSFWGRALIEFPLELERNMSNHLKVRAPSKTSLIDVKIKNTSTEYNNIDNYFDSKLLHLMFTSEQSKSIWDDMANTKVEEEKPKVEVIMSVTTKKSSPYNNPIAKITLLSIMTILMYISFIPSFVATFTNYLLFSRTEIFSNMTVTFALSIAIISHSFDRKFLVEFSKMHFLLVSAIWLIILFFYFLGIVDC